MRALQFPVLSPGDNDMHDGMPELEDYVDVVADLLMVNLHYVDVVADLLMVNLPQHRGTVHVHFFMYDDMPVLEENVDVVADLLMVNLPQNQGSLHGHGFLLQSAASCESRREEGRIVNMRSPETSSSSSVTLVADSFAIYLQ